MPAGICLPPKIVDSFTEALRSGKLNPERLASMTSEARHKLLSDVVGEGNAKFVNSQFEAKMLLKNQQLGYINWAKKLTGVKPAVRQDLLTKISKMDKILNPTEEKAFLKDLAETRLGVGVSVKEAQKIAILSSKVQEAKALPRSSLTDSYKRDWQPTANDMKYGHAAYDLHDYVNGLKHEAAKVKLSSFKSQPFKLPAHVLKMTADVSKSIGASLDDSFALRQGMKAFWTNNRLWQKNFRESFVNIAKGFKDHAAVEREMHARLMADPAYESAIKDGLAIKANEDVFPTSLPGKVPILGRAFSATEVGYNAFAENLRMGIYKQQMKLGEELGTDIPKDYGKNMANMVNSLTGRGNFGKQDMIAGPLNVAFYSARFLKSNVDTLLLHPLGVGTGGLGSKAQIKAATNLVKIIAGTAAILETANALKPGSVEFDPRSSDFGKIKIGHTRFDVSGGMGSIVTLAARVASGKSKSSATGIITQLGSGFGKTSQLDVVTQFFENKLSPVGGVIRDKLKGQDMQGNPFSIKREATNLFTPLTVSNYKELKNDPKSANMIVSMIADSLGIATNTYGLNQKNYQLNPSATLTQFQNKVGSAKFQQANKDYNKAYQAWFNQPNVQEQYNALPNGDKSSFLTAAKAKIQNKIYREYGFKPTKNKSSSQLKSAKKGLIDSIK